MKTLLLILLLLLSQLADAVTPKMTNDDLPELTDVIGKHGSPKRWCVFLKISPNSCNGLAHQHPGDMSLYVAEAYLKEILNPCWKEIVRVLCKDFKCSNPAQELSIKHSVDFHSQCP